MLEQTAIASRASGIRRAIDSPGVRVAWRALWASRLVVLLSGVFAVLSFGLAAGWPGFDPTRLTAPFGYFGNLLVAPFARWDSSWFLAIAQGNALEEATVKILEYKEMEPFFLKSESGGRRMTV